MIYHLLHPQININIYSLAVSLILDIFTQHIFLWIRLNFGVLIIAVKHRDHLKIWERQMDYINLQKFQSIIRKPNQAQKNWVIFIFKHKRWVKNSQIFILWNDFWFLEISFAAQITCGNETNLKVIVLGSLQFLSQIKINM